MNASACLTMNFEFFVQEHRVKFKSGNTLVTNFWVEKVKLDRSMWDGLTENRSKSQKLN